MGRENDRFVIIDTSGRAENVKDCPTWFSILEDAYLRVGTAGSSTPLPDMLLRNGKIVVEGGLHKIAWQYGTSRAKAIDFAAATVKAQYQPPWGGEP